MKKIDFETIKKIDYLLIFIAGIIAAIAAIAFLVSALIYAIPKSKSSPNIKIIDTSDTAEKVEIVESIEFNRKLKDVYVFSLITSAIKADEMENDRKMPENAMSNSLEYSANNDGLTNYIFVKDGKENKLFSFKGYIYKSFFANEKKCDFNVYAVIKEDSDNDKKLTSKDKISLYISDYDGRKLEEISSEIYEFRMMEKNIFLFTEFQNNLLSFYEYDCNSKTKKLIKKIEQKKVQKSIDMNDYSPILIHSD